MSSPIVRNVAEDHVTAREFEARIADVREDHQRLARDLAAKMDELRGENAEDHKAVVDRLGKIESSLSRVVTWPALATAVTAAAAVVGLALGIAR